MSAEPSTMRSTLTLYGFALTPNFRTSWHVRSAPTTSTSKMATLQPFDANCKHISRPMPLLPPVTFKCTHAHTHTQRETNEMHQSKFNEIIASMVSEILNVYSMRGICVIAYYHSQLISYAVQWLWNHQMVYICKHRITR